MTPSAATVMLEFARERYRIVRDANTERVFAVPKDDGPPVPSARLGQLLDRAYSDATGRVAPVEAARRVIEILASGELPVEEIESAVEQIEVTAERLQELAERAARLRTSDDVLAELDKELHADGFAGDTRNPRFVFLSTCTAFLDIGRDGLAERMASVKVDGASSSGKNFAVDAAVLYIPDGRVIRITGMSQKALVYGDEPLERKFLYFPEGAGIRDDSDAAIYLRSLLSEGEIRYEVVYTQPGGPPEATTIVRSGPTAAIITTSAVRLDRDLDNRLLRVTIDDSEQLTRRIIERHGERAARGGTPTRDRSEWHALYEWILLQAPNQVRIPFAPVIATLIPASAVRLRRDAQTVFTLTAAHAALHLDSRTRDTDGYVVATGADYDAARDLVDSILGANVEQIAPPWAQETWEAVPPNIWEDGITYAALGRRLGIGTDAARTRALRLIELGQIVNLESRWKQPARLVQGDKVPEGAGGFLPHYSDVNPERRSPRDRSRSPEPPSETPVETGETDRVEEPEPQAEPAAPSREGSGAGDGSRDRPEPTGPGPNGSSAPRSGDLARDEELCGQKAPGMCHVCEARVDEQALTPATLYGGRLTACPDCLRQWPSIRPENPRKRQPSSGASTAAGFQLDLDPAEHSGPAQLTGREVFPTRSSLTPHEQLRGSGARGCRGHRGAGRGRGRAPSRPAGADLPNGARVRRRQRAEHAGDLQADQEGRPLRSSDRRPPVVAGRPGTLRNTP